MQKISVIEPVDTYTGNIGPHIILTRWQPGDGTKEECVTATWSEGETLVTLILCGQLFFESLAVGIKIWDDIIESGNYTEVK